MSRPDPSGPGRRAVAAGLALSPWLRPLPSRAQGVEHHSEPLVARDGVLPVDPAALPGGVVPVRFEGLDALAERPVLGPGTEGPGHALLRRLHDEGRAAGNAGDLYENRDAGHSALPAARHPQITRIAWARPRAAEARGLAAVVFGAPTVGNASVAIRDGALWRSMPRLALTQGALAGRDPGPGLHAGYSANRLHVYPEHRDFDPEHGDLTPAQTPYWVISRGSSGSDGPFLEALAMILAALRPETKARAAAQGLIASTLQMVLRRSMTPSRAAYLTGAAHPAALDGRAIDLAEAVRLASALGPEVVPPVVRLSVLEEDMPDPAEDPLATTLGERLMDAPEAVARLWRSTAYQRSMLVAADAPEDVGIRWALLQGDPARVRVEPEAGGRRARITWTWQGPRTAATVGGRRVPIRSSRVDVAAFAETGRWVGAPSFVSMLLPHHEVRRYEGAAGATRIASIDRTPALMGYADPLLWPRVPWREAFARDAEGRLTGRMLSAEGVRLALGPDGRRADGTTPRYGLAADAEGRPQVVLR